MDRSAESGQGAIFDRVCAEFMQREHERNAGRLGKGTDPAGQLNGAFAIERRQRSEGEAGKATMLPIARRENLLRFREGVKATVEQANEFAVCRYAAAGLGGQALHAVENSLEG
jgi:hypothetical protein